MWRLLLVCCTGVCLLSGGKAAAPRPGPAGCVLTESPFPKHAMSVGETFNTGPEPCASYTCVEPNQWSSVSCPPVEGAPDGCEVVQGNQSAVYPGCCVHVSCGDNVLGVDQPFGKTLQE
ncbi:uncharacterized protein LOC113213132 [Frankliniella occidentalis]|uniref:Uncharacterized protein LOC113213132 n=1 Tax=Frankliniella occidentalis TaxID=133901 RepID=A0A6J1T885_FRAOC|nr:uncharacterized protein LOC113213132 [Frankliniella occidentalis]